MYHEFELSDTDRFHKIMGIVCFLHLLLLTGLGFYETENEKMNITTRMASHFKQPTQKVQITLNAQSLPIKQGAPLSEMPSRLNDVTARRIVSESSANPQDRLYLERWQGYVENYGNRHYPSALLKHNLSGTLQLSVAIRKDGSLYDVILQQSSGSTILDNAAIKIVQSAAPFDPIPAEMLAESEILEIIRTWEFRGKLATSA